LLGDVWRYKCGFAYVRLTTAGFGNQEIARSENRATPFACGQCATRGVLNPPTAVDGLLRRAQNNRAVVAEATTPHTTVVLPQVSLQASDLPMLWHIAEPVDARRFELDVGIHATGNGVGDDGLFLLVQQF